MLQPPTPEQSKRRARSIPDDTQPGAVYWQARIMVMDEPTAALGVPEQRKVMDLIRMLKGRGVPVILISHNMQDVFEISDRIFVMRRGSNVGDFPTAETNSNEVVRTMIGG